MSKMNRDELLELIPAYVLGALDPDELAEVEALLVDSAEAQALADDYREMMGDVVPLMAEMREPEPSAKDRLFAKIQTTQPEDTKPLPAPVVVPPTRRILRLTLFIPVAAAIIFAVIGLGVVLQDFTQSQTPEGMFYAVANQPDSLKVTVNPTDEQPVRGELVVTGDQGQAILRLMQLPDLETNQTFEMWLIDDSGAHSGGLFQTEDSNEAFFILNTDRPINQYAAFGVSVEPEGGSPSADGPSTTPIFLVNPPIGT